MRGSASPSSMHIIAGPSASAPGAPRRAPASCAGGARAAAASAARPSSASSRCSTEATKPERKPPPISSPGGAEAEPSPPPPAESRCSSAGPLSFWTSPRRDPASIHALCSELARAAWMGTSTRAAAVLSPTAVSCDASAATASTTRAWWLAVATASPSPLRTASTEAASTRSRSTAALTARSAALMRGGRSLSASKDSESVTPPTPPGGRRPTRVASLAASERAPVPPGARRTRAAERTSLRACVREIKSESERVAEKES